MIHSNTVAAIPVEHITPDMIRAELERLKWHQTEAARYLRINERTLRRYLQEGPGSAPMPFASYALLRITRA